MCVQLQTEGGEKFTNQLGTDSYCPNICFCLVCGKSCCKKCCGLINGSINILTLRVFLNMFFLQFANAFVERRLEAKTVEIPTISDSLRAPLLRSFGYTQDFLIL